ncbi:MAG TPA: hypothetical protein GX509_07735 [Firmicutes bacterium]|nr:hypothetical protein [Bacillota bacterium]
MKRCVPMMLRISWVIFILSAVVLPAVISPATIQASGSKPGQDAEPRDIPIILGRSILLSFDGLTRAAVGDPRVADVVVISGNEILLNAKAPGETTLHVWDKSGVKVYLVKVSRNESETAAIVKKLIGLPGVSVKTAGGVILLEGNVDRPEDKAKAEEVAKAYADKVLSFIVISPAGSQKTVEVVVEVIKGTEKSTVNLREPAEGR